MKKRVVMSDAKIRKRLIAAGDILSEVREELDLQHQNGTAADAVDQIDVLDNILNDVDSLIADFTDEGDA